MTELEFTEEMVAAAMAKADARACAGRQPLLRLPQQR
jgi:hypothetical protein